MVRAKAVESNLGAQVGPVSNSTVELGRWAAERRALTPFVMERSPERLVLRAWVTFRNRTESRLRRNAR
jgi:hypothetical protein